MLRSAGQTREFEEQGFLTFTQQHTLAAELPDVEVFRTLLAGPGTARDASADRHLDDALTYRICTLPALLEQVSALLGPDLLLWHSRYFDRAAGTSPIPWHQDAPFWALEPRRCVSAWVALEDTHEGNGCIEVLPGSNRIPLPQVASEGTGRFRRKADIAGVDLAGALPLPLRRGEFFLFDAWLLHRSGRNHATRSRIALSINYISPDVKVDLERPRRRNPRYGVQLVRGRDGPRLNPHAPPPPGADR